MHELAIANTIMEHVQTQLDADDFPKVTKIVVRIGQLTDIVPDALLFNFDAIKLDTPLARAQLEIEERQVMAHCNACGGDFTVESYFFLCPECSSGDVKVTAGEELDIVYVEVEDAEP